MKKPTNEFARMQELAGINEIKVRKPAPNIADFLNQHKEEVFEKMFGKMEDEGIIYLDDMTDWKEKYDNNPGYNYICAQVDFPDASLGAQARSTPFPPEVFVDYEWYIEQTEIDIAGKTIYYGIFNY